MPMQMGGRHAGGTIVAVLSGELDALVAANEMEAASERLPDREVLTDFVTSLRDQVMCTPMLPRREHATQVAENLASLYSATLLSGGRRLMLSKVPPVP